MRIRRHLRPLPLVAAVLGVCIATGCGGDDTTRPAHPADAPPTANESAERRRQRESRSPAPTCPARAANCRAASGRVIGLESVDADGDGDLHPILASRTSITLPGITVLDINKDLRPAQDPRIGDWAAGAGPVYSGSYGQSQIQVDQVVYDPRRGG